MINIKTVFLSLAVCISLSFYHYAHAQDTARADSLKQQIIKSISVDDSYNAFEELTDIYFSANKFNEFIGFLEGLAKERKDFRQLADYFTALSRYYQLKHLEETQNWDEYFASGNTYREEIVSRAKAAIGATGYGSPLNLYAKLVLWKFHKEQNDVFEEEALESLMNAALEYSKNKDCQALYIKAVADELGAYGEKGRSRQLYKVYMEFVLSEKISASELKNIADGLYREGNFELAQLVYDAYIEKITPDSEPEELTLLLFEIAASFVYDDARESDPAYAEKIFDKIEKVAGDDIFNQEHIYMRALNLEKSMAYAEAKDTYLNLISRFPQSERAEEAAYKIGLIYAYILGEFKSGIVYFERLAGKDILGPQALASLYQLGLLSQWQQEKEKAEQYYQRLKDKAGKNFPDMASLADERLAEIGREKPIEYNLKTFLDLSLTQEGRAFNMSKLDLKASPVKAKQGQPVSLTAFPSLPASGCMHIELEYLWSGDFSQSSRPDISASSFSLQYPSPGTKLVSLVAVSPSGVIDRGISIIDIE